MFTNTLNALSRNMHLAIIALYAYVLLNHVKEDQYVVMIFLTLATCMAICYLKKNRVEGLVAGAATADAATADAAADAATADAAAAADVPSLAVKSVPSNMSMYDGLCLQTGNQEHWMKNPDNTALIPNANLFAYLSSQGPLKPVFTDNSSLHGPPVDGVQGSEKKMFMLANNRASPNCCPSTFSTSTGCICTTKNQRDFVASRGHNNPKVSLKDI
jgi:hypothetical protein